MEVIVIEYRVENKYIVSDLDIAVLKKRLSMVMKEDVHQRDGCYEIRSVYFDDLYDSCFEENEAGIDCRRKYRIRIYDSSSLIINMEIKEKKSGLTRKRSCKISREECELLLAGKSFLEFANRTPLNELVLKMQCTGMRPKIIVAYERTAFVHPTGNVRITFDRNIMASKENALFFDTHIAGMVPILPIGMHVLEVKYDEVLPDIIAKQLELGKLCQTAFSKYYLGRMAVMGEFPYGI